MQSDDRTWPDQPVQGSSLGAADAVASTGAGGQEPDGEYGLADRAMRGDQTALRRLWHEHRRWVAAVLLAHMPRESELDDLLQEVAVAVVAKVSGLREAAAFRPWLRAVAISIAKTSARRGKVRKTGLLRIAGFAGAAREEESVAGPGQRETLREGRRLMELSAELPDGYREPLILKCVQGMSYRQIGRVMGLPETTVETRIARARRMLRERAVAAGLGPRDQGAGGDDDEPAAAASLEDARVRRPGVRS